MALNANGGGYVDNVPVLNGQVDINKYNSGFDSTTKRNNKLWYYHTAGLKAAEAAEFFGQFVDRNYVLPKHTGKEFRISRYFNSYDRDFLSDGWLANGWLTNRDITEFVALLDSNTIVEGQGTLPSQSLKAITLSAQLEEYGEATIYTDQLDIFSEDQWYGKLHYDLGKRQGQIRDDRIQLDMLQTPTRFFTGLATSKKTIGAGITLTPASSLNEAEYLPAYDDFRVIAKKLKSYRAEPVTKIVTGSTNVDTKVVGKSYFAVVGSDVKFDLETIVNPHDGNKLAWIPPERYAASVKNLARGEVGYISRSNFRFLESERVFVFKAAGAPVPFIRTSAESTVYGGLSEGSYKTGGSLTDQTGSLLYEGQLQYSTIDWRNQPGANDAEKKANQLTAIKAKRDGTAAFIIVPATAGDAFYVEASAIPTVADITNYFSSGATTVESASIDSLTGVTLGSATVILVDSYFNVHPIIIPAAEAFAEIGLKGESKLNWILKPPGKAAADFSNMLGKRGFMSVSWWYCGLIIREENLAVLFTASTSINGIGG